MGLFSKVCNRSLLLLLLLLLLLSSSLLYFSSIICDQSQSQWFINKTIYVIVYQKYHALNFIGNILLTESGPNLDKKYVRFSDAALSHEVLRKINFVLKPLKKGWNKGC